MNDHPTGLWQNELLHKMTVDRAKIDPEINALYTKLTWNTDLTEDELDVLERIFFGSSNE